MSVLTPPTTLVHMDATLESRTFDHASYFAGTRMPINEATTLHPRSYKDPAMYEAEKCRVFETSWMCVGTVHDFATPGTVRAQTVGRQPVFLARGEDGHLRAFKNEWRHRPGPVVDSSICERKRRFVCGRERWCYSLDGSLASAPRVHVSQRGDFGLLPVRIDTFAHLVYINMDGKAPPLREYLGCAADQLVEHAPLLANPSEMVVAGTKTYRSKSNWKLLMENFMEYYHLPSVHPSLCAVSSVNAHQRTQGAGMNTSFITRPLSSGGTPLDPHSMPHLPGLTGDNHVTAWFHAIFPNVFYFCLPHTMFTVRLEPVSASVTLEHAELLVHKNAAAPEHAETVKEAFAFYDETNLEDIEICEAVQRGVSASDYTGGRFSFRFEETIHRFQNMYIDHMLGQPKVPGGDDVHLPGDAWYS